MNTRENRSKHKSPIADAKQHICARRDKDFIEARFISASKGRGVFAKAHIVKGSFIVEYRGRLSEAKDRAADAFTFYFKYKGSRLCIDCSLEDDSLGRLVNDDSNPNSKMKLIVVNETPHLCLFALRDIEPGEEITYDYGGYHLPWRTVKQTDGRAQTRLVDKSVQFVITEQDQKDMLDSQDDKKIPDISSDEEDMVSEDNNDKTKNVAPSGTEHSSVGTSKQNYCYVCGKSVTKLARHFELHKGTEYEIAVALKLPKRSKERKHILQILKNRGHFLHGVRFLKTDRVLLKARRRPDSESSPNNLENCLYCEGTFVRGNLAQHVRSCKLNPNQKTEQHGRSGSLDLAAMANYTNQKISEEVKKLLISMNQDEVTHIIRGDDCILQLAQAFINKYASAEKHAYIQQTLRAVGKFLLVLRKRSSIKNLWDAMQPANLPKVIETVKEVARFDAKKNCFEMPAVACKIKNALLKLCKEIVVRLRNDTDTEKLKSTEMFLNVLRDKWAELPLTMSKIANKPSPLTFTQDVQILHNHLDKTAESAMKVLMETTTPQSYTELCKVTLAQITLFNRGCKQEVSKLSLQNFRERKQSEVPKNSTELTEFEKKLCQYFSSIEVLEKMGKKLRIILTPDMVKALTLLNDKRALCEVSDSNESLFAKPNSNEHYWGPDVLKVFVKECGAKNPEHLRSKEFQKHVSILSQVLSLRNSDLVLLAGFLGYDISLKRDYYRLSEAAPRLAKICKLILSIEGGSVTSLIGQSLDDVTLCDKIHEGDSDDMDGSEDDDGDDSGEEDIGNNKSDEGHVSIAPKDKENPENQDSSCKPVSKENPSSRKKAKFNSQPRKPWKKSEVAAVMKHFKKHIQTGRRATVAECAHCLLLEQPALERRTIQNVRDFVRNKGLSLKRSQARQVTSVYCLPELYELMSV